MNPKSLLIPIAAFAVAVTGVQAFNSELLQEAGLTESQIEAFETAKELRQEGDKGGARDLLIEAGIDEDTIHSIREVMHQDHDSMHIAMEKALEDNDFEAFKVAVVGSPLADIITTQADFELFKEAHNHREAAKEIMDELGFENSEHGGMMGHHKSRFELGS